MEGLRRRWACGLGRHAIRVVTLQTGGVPETLPDDFAGRDDIVAGIRQASGLNRTVTLADVGNLAAFVASDQARPLTSADASHTCGKIMD